MCRLVAMQELQEGASLVVEGDERKQTPCHPHRRMSYESQGSAGNSQGTRHLHLVPWLLPFDRLTFPVFFPHLKVFLYEVLMKRENNGPATSSHP